MRGGAPQLEIAMGLSTPSSPVEGPADLTATVRSAYDMLPDGGVMGALIRALDWSATPLGPAEDWPQSLRTALSILLDSRYPTYIAWGPEFTQFYNDAYRPILGATKHPAALGQGTRECFAEIWNFIGPMFERVMLQGEATWLEDQILALDRYGYVEECYFTFSYSAIRNESGRPGGVLVTVIETTDRVLGERRLRTLRELTGATARAADDAAACDAAAAVLAGNPHDVPFIGIYLFDDPGRGARRTGLAGAVSPADPRLPAVISPDPGTGWFADLIAAAYRGGATTLELGGTGGETILSAAWSEPVDRAVVLPIVLPPQSAPAGFMVIGVNPRKHLDDGYLTFLTLVASQVAAAVGEARALVEERRRAQALAALNLAKTTFFTNVSHEFRTPLTLLLGPLQDVLGDEHHALAPAHRAHLELAQRNSLRLLKLVNGLLDFSRLEAGEATAEREPTDLAGLTADLASTFRSAIERAGLRLEVDCPPLPQPAYVDRGMWEKIVLNLLSNAFKFTLSGGITVRLRAVDGHVELTVRDTGCGIPAADVPLVFNRFHRAAHTTGRTHEGTGIGLSLVRELTRLHGGDVTLASTVGSGTTVRLIVPLGAPQSAARGRLAAGAPRGSLAAAFVDEAARWAPSPETGAAAFGLERDPNPGAMPGAHVLVVDDNTDMRGYIGRLLGARWRVTAAMDGLAALEAIRRDPPDLVLSDVMMPRLDGVGLLREMRADPSLAGIPVLLLSARAGEESRVAGLGTGADDYITKPFAAPELVARVETHLRMLRLRRDAAGQEHRLLETEREAADALRRSEARLRSVIDSNMIGIAFWDGDRVTDANDALLTMLGYTPADLAAGELRHGRLTPPEYAKLDARALAEVRQRGACAPYEKEFLRKDGTRVPVLAGGTGLADGGGGVFFLLDLTDLRQAQAQLQAAQRLESVGHLAGGVAHEINNALQACIGFSVFAIEALEPASPVRSDVEQVLRSADRAAHVTQQLLAFSRRQILRPAVLDLNDVVRGFDPMLRQALGPASTLVVEPSPAPASVFADRSQIEQVLLNLALNARDAMPSGGTLTVRVEQATAGTGVRLMLADTGTGMSALVRNRVLEPFFTTKPTGQGTGLGLSVVHGIVTQSGGTLDIESTPGDGTTVAVTLPATDRPVSRPDPAQPSGAGRGHERILVVDDDEQVLTVARRSLEEAGYSVHTADAGHEALENCRAAVAGGRPFDLVMTDMIMRGMRGTDLGRAIAERVAADQMPPTPVLYSSGHTGDEMVLRGELRAGAPFIQKPFTPDALVACVRRVLDERAERP